MTSKYFFLFLALLLIALFSSLTVDVNRLSIVIKYLRAVLLVFLISVIFHYL